MLMSSEALSSSRSGVASPITHKRWVRVLLPLLFLYLLNFIDRNNISFAIIGGMKSDLTIGNAEAGLAAGVFYVGYLVLQIPAGVLAERFDVKRMIVVFGVLWGLLAMATGLVQNFTELLLVRFLLGLVDGGVWTAILVLLSRWFADRERATANSIWLMCLPLSFVIMGPVSGIILQATSWRWLFVIEGFPAIVFALVVLIFASPTPAAARWLPDAERDYITSGQADASVRTDLSGFREAVFHPQVLLLSAVYFFWLIGAVGFFTWVPAIMKQVASTGVAATGLLSALPYVAAMLGLLVIGRFADHTGRRRLFVGVDLACFAVFLLLSTLLGSNEILSLVLLVAAGFFLFAMHAPFWSIPMETVPVPLIGAALGMVSLVGNVGSFIGPYLVGYVQQATGSFQVGLYALVGSLIVAAALTIFIREEPADMRVRVGVSVPTT